jgi:hypothetical protein
MLPLLACELQLKWAGQWAPSTLHFCCKFNPFWGLEAQAHHRVQHELSLSYYYLCWLSQSGALCDVPQKPKVRCLDYAFKSSLFLTISPFYFMICSSSAFQSLPVPSTEPQYGLLTNLPPPLTGDLFTDPSPMPKEMITSLLLHSVNLRPLHQCSVDNGRRRQALFALIWGSLVRVLYCSRLNHSLQHFLLLKL